MSGMRYLIKVNAEPTSCELIGAISLGVTMTLAGAFINP